MDETRNYHSQKTDTRTENQTPHGVTHKWELNIENTWIQGGEQYTTWPVGVWGTRGEIHNVDDGEIDAVNHHGTCIPM